MNQTVERSVRCDCIGGEHYLNFTLFTDNTERKELSVDLFAKNKPWGKRKWKLIWDIIKGKDVCYDGIILERAKQLEIVDFLNGILNKDLVDVDLPPNGD